MEAELVALASAAGATLAGLMATDAWERSKKGIAVLWRRVGPGEPTVVEGELGDARERLMSGQNTEQEIVEELTRRVAQLLAADPQAKPEIVATAYAQGRNYVVGRGSMVINER
ncbi:hypothetical protein AB0B74_25990 [Micromonospora parva]|uniref:hypothetical protein n=1 Tax=Micromonospora parva TaxID=1464048 RepID=UPI0033F2E722